MKQRLLIAMATAVTLALLLAVVAVSQGIDSRVWHTVDGGGGVSEGGTFTVRGTIGQVDAGPMTGKEYVLSGGFWVGGSSTVHKVYLPLIVKSP